MCFSGLSEVYDTVATSGIWNLVIIEAATVQPELHSTCKVPPAPELTNKPSHEISVSIIKPVPLKTTNA